MPKAAVKQAEDLTGAWAQEHLERVAARAQEHGILVQMVTVERRPQTEIVQFAESNWAFCF